jgi:hypothetical protein
MFYVAVVVVVPLMEVVNFSGLQQAVEEFHKNIANNNNK